ncbi:MAG: nitroreductase family protein [Xanthomonadales bacterium]|nr:nitroreductase family protein [Xanthomonadales bacterium]
MTSLLEEIRNVRQSRKFTDELVTDDQLATLLEVAQWTGSSQNTQPWHFIVIRDKDQLRKVSEVRGDAIKWVATAPLAIALVISAKGEISGAFDEGRVTERLMIAARMLGLGAGTAWYGDDTQRAAAKELLGIPAELSARSMVVIGHPAPGAQSSGGGRKPLSELVSYDRMS